jgi:aldehyde:ferredoxin oxidoreductase
VTDVLYMLSGNVLVVDLDDGSVDEAFLDEGLARDRVGGALLGLEFLRQHADGDPVVIAAGPLTGSLVPTASAVSLTARSPLTGRVVHCSLTNHAGLEFKYAGYDVLVVRGRSPRPVYLWVHDEQVDLVDAGDLWGSDVFDICDAVRERQGDERVQVVSAGPACTAASLASALSVNYWASTDRAAVGALFGAKNLLAVAARGMGEIEPADIEGFGPAALRLVGGIREREAAGTKFAWDAGNLDAAREAVAPLVHRHRGCFFCASRGRPYLMLDGEPSRMEQTAVRAPGVLLADLLPLQDLAAAGMDGRAMAEVTRTTYRLGLDPARAAAALRGSGARDPASARPVLDGLARGEGAPSAGSTMVPWHLGDATGGHDAFVDLGVFTPANPPQVPTRGLDGAENLLVQQGLAYILGLCPAGAVGAGIDAKAVAEVTEAATGLGLSAPDLEGLARRLVAETIALSPTAPTGTAGELAGRFP